MPQKSPAKANSEGSAKVIVFGVDNVDWLPRAGWFPKNQADAARAAAKQLHLYVVEVTNGIAADLAAKIPEGRVHVRGPGAVPTVREDLYEKVVATINGSGPAAIETWDAIKPGHLVIAHESLRDGWWEAIVVERTGDKVTLRWREYAGQPPFTVPVTAVALLNPTRP